VVSGKGYGDGLRHLIFAENLTGETRNLYGVSGMLGVNRILVLLASLFLAAFIHGGVV